MSSQPPTPGPPANAVGTDSPAWGWLLAVWMSLVLVLNGIAWTTGVVDHDLAQAVENGAAQVERRRIHEESDDVVRKAIQTQRDTLRFWTVIAALRDFLAAPMSLVFRVFTVAITFSALAALTGRPVRFPAAVADCVVWQGLWVLGLAVEVVLMLALQRPHVETSVLMFLPRDSFTARQWTALQQVDCFAIIGWLGMAWGIRRRGQASLFVALIVCFVLAAAGGYVCYRASLLVNLSMRMTLFPQ